MLYRDPKGYKPKFSRLLQYMALRNLRDIDIARACGLSSGYMSQCRAGKSDIGRRVLDSLKDRYPELNVHWVETGEGDMLVCGPVISHSSSVVLGGSFNRCDINNSTQNDRAALAKAIDDLEEQRRLNGTLRSMLEKCQAQMDKMQQHIDALLALLGRQDAR